MRGRGLAVTVRTQERPPLWRDATVLKWTAQVALLIALGIVFVTLFDQARTNLDERGISTFQGDFLDDPPGISRSARPSSSPRTFWMPSPRCPAPARRTCSSSPKP